MYLTDLSFIEEGTPDFTEDNLVNFSKMRMVCIPYSLNPVPNNNFLDWTKLKAFADDELYAEKLRFLCLKG